MQTSYLSPGCLLPTGRNLAFEDSELTEIDRYATDLGINLWAASSDVV
jgi:hypothetical protein